LTANAKTAFVNNIDLADCELERKN
jgi:hypothetical protein